METNKTEAEIEAEMQKVCNEITRETIDLFDGQVELNRTNWTNIQMCQIVENAICNIAAHLFANLSKATPLSPSDCWKAIDMSHHIMTCLEKYDQQYEERLEKETNRPKTIDDLLQTLIKSRPKSERDEISKKFERLKEILK